MVLRPDGSQLRLPLLFESTEAWNPLLSSRLAVTSVVSPMPIVSSFHEPPFATLFEFEWLIDDE